MKEIELLAARLGDNGRLYINLQNILFWAFEKQTIEDIPASEANKLFTPFFKKGFSFFSALESFTCTSRLTLLQKGAAAKGTLPQKDFPFLRYFYRPWNYGKTSYVPRGDTSLFFLGWDSGVALERTPEGYTFAAHTVSDKTAVSKNVHLINEDGSDSGYELLKGSGVGRVMTVNVSSCSVCLVMDDSMNHLLFTHLDAHSASPFSTLKKEAGWNVPLTTIVVSMVHDTDEMQRILGFALEIGVKRIEILDRGVLPASPTAPPANLHLYAGLLLQQQTPSMFISFGSARQLIQSAQNDVLNLKEAMKPNIFFNTLTQQLGYTVNRQQLYAAAVFFCRNNPDVLPPANDTPQVLMKFLINNNIYLDTDPAFLEAFSSFFRSYCTPPLRSDGRMLT